MSLSEESINKAIKELKDYKKEVQRKAKILVDKMVQFGEDYAINQVGHIDTGETVASIHGYRNGNKGVIVAGGNAIWIEFGAGVRYNTKPSPHPKGEELGMTIGDYPGKGQGNNPQGWWYYGDDGEVHHTYGIQSNQFFWRTARELERVAPELAKEVFSK